MVIYTSVAPGLTFFPKLFNSTLSKQKRVSGPYNKFNQPKEPKKNKTHNQRNENTVKTL